MSTPAQVTITNERSNADLARGSWAGIVGLCRPWLLAGASGDIYVGSGVLAYSVRYRAFVHAGAHVYRCSGQCRAAERLRNATGAFDGCHAHGLTHADSRGNRHRAIAGADRDSRLQCSTRTGFADCRRAQR